MDNINTTNFSNFTKLSSNREYMSSVYTQKPAVQYYNEPTQEQKKKKKVFKYSLLATSTIATGALIASIFKHKNPQKTKEAIEKFFKNSQDAIREFNFKEKFSNTFSNIINIKDDIWDRFSKKTAHTPLFFVEKIGNWITGVYKESQKLTHKKKFDDVVGKLKSLGYDNNKLLGFDEWFNKTNDYMKNSFQKKRITKGIFNKDIIKTISGENLADKQLRKDWLAKEYLIPEGESDEVKKLIEEYNSIKATLLPKLRDINCGSAPTDLLTILTATGGLGVAAATAKDKEERKSIVVNLGIPLIGTLLGSTYCTMKSLSGTKGLIYGAIIGQVASIGAKTIDKFVLNKNQEETKKADYNA